MRSVRVTSKTVGVLFGTALLAVAQPTPDQPDALDLLKNVALTYHAMRTLSAKLTSVMNGPDMQQKIEMPMTIMADSSGKMRVENTGVTGMLMVFDGSTMWIYMSSFNKYTKLPLSSAASSAQPDSFFGYQSVATDVKEAKILRSEKLQVNGSHADCWVVQLQYEPAGARTLWAKTLWVDKTHYFVYREDWTSKMAMPGTSAPTETKHTIKFDTISLDQPVPEDTFTFTPPSGATEGSGVGQPSPLFDGCGVFSSVFCVQPWCIYCPDPSYSEEARKACLSGAAVVQIIVDAAGNVRDVRVVKPLGLGLDEKAVEAIRTWRFFPSLRNGVPVNVVRPVEVSFRIAPCAPRLGSETKGGRSR